jgi:hypothetical protein
MVLTVLSLRRMCERSLVPKRPRADMGHECSGARVIEWFGALKKSPSTGTGVSGRRRSGYAGGSSTPA